MGKQLEDLPPEVLLNIVSNFCCCESNCDKIVDADTIPREDSPLKHLNVNCHDHGTLASLCRTSKRLGVYATEHLYHVLNFRYDAIMSELVEGAPPSVRTREKSALCLLETVASRLVSQKVLRFATILMRSGLTSHKTPITCVSRSGLVICADDTRCPRIFITRQS